MLTAYKYRIYPTNNQMVLISKHFGHCRWVYNWGLATKQKVYASTGKSMSKFDLSNLLPTMKKAEETCWLSEVNSQSLQSSLDNLDQAFVSFFDKRSKFPKFKSKHSSKQSFIIPANTKVDFDHGRVYLPKFKEPIKIKLSRKIIGDIRKSTVSKNASGEYYISILVEDGLDVPTKVDLHSKDEVLGIDVGIKDFCTTSEGEVVENQKFLQSKQSRLKMLHRKLAHKQKGSNNRAKAKLKVARLHQRIVNQRTDFLHKLSTRLVRENKAIAREDLNVKRMLKNHNLALAISDVAWTKFDHMLEYKSVWQGKHFLQIGRFEASSKTCNKCGHYHPNLKLSDRILVCESCANVQDRDVNAALNIRDWSFFSFLKGENDQRGIHKNTQGHVKFKSVSPQGNKKPKSKDEVAPGQKEDLARTSNSKDNNIVF